MTPADSKLLARLDAAIGSAPNPIRAACLRAERAGYRARQGHFEEARTELVALREQFGKRPQPEVSVWLCLLEGWIGYYGHVDPAALDWIKRAHALSVAMSLGPLRALAAAWLAHLHYVFDSCDEAARFAREALDVAQASEHGARARAALVVAGLCHFAGHFELAKPWYVTARMHARSADDAQALSALSFNMASQQLRDALMAAVFTKNDDDLLRQAAAGTQATESFDDWIGTASLASLLPTMRATVASLRGEHRAALEMFGADFSATEKDGLARLVPMLLAERAWCRLQTGETELARADAQAAASRTGDPMDDDDRAIAHGRLAQVFAGLGDRTRSDEERAGAQEALARHRATQAQALDALLARQLVEVEAPEVAPSH